MQQCINVQAAALAPASMQMRKAAISSANAWVDLQIWLTELVRENSVLGIRADVELYLLQSTDRPRGLASGSRTGRGRWQGLR